MNRPTRRYIALALTVAALVIGLGCLPSWPSWAFAATLALAAVFLTPFE